MHEKSVIGTGGASSNMIPHGIVPAHELSEPEHRGEVDTNRPFLIAGCFGIFEIFGTYFAHYYDSIVFLHLFHSSLQHL